MQNCQKAAKVVKRDTGIVMGYLNTKVGPLFLGMDNNVEVFHINNVEV